MSRLVTYNPSSFWISIPNVTLQDFRISYYSTRLGTMLGTDGYSSHYVSQGDGTIRISANTYTFLTAPPQPEGEREGHFYFQKITYERIGNQLSLYLGDSDTPVETKTCTTSPFILNALHRSNSGVDADGIAWDIKIEDLSDPGSTNNRFYALDETFDDLVAVDSVSSQNGSYSSARPEDRVDEMHESEYGFRSRKLGYLKDVDKYDKSQAKVIASFSASVLRLILFNERRQDFEFEMFQRGAEIEFHQYGDGGETLEVIVQDTPNNIANLLAMGYAASNISALVHAGGNDVSNSLTYGANKDTSDLIINMASRLNQLYNLFDAEGFTIYWLPISWRNYGTMPPESGGSLPYNENIVLPFIKNTVGASSWDFDNDVPKYDFYNFVKDGFAADNTFLSDSVHPGQIGQDSSRVQIAEWLAPNYLTASDTTAPVVTNNGLETLTLTVGDTYTPDFTALDNNDGVLSVTVSDTVDTNTAGTYTVTATATDAAGNVGSATQTVIVEAAQQVNQPPVANAGPDQSVAAATQFTLDGTGSQDTDGNIVEWRWTQTAGDTVTLDLENPARPTATSPSKTTAQRLTFQLVTVDDEGAVSSPSMVNIDVAAVVQNDVLNIIDKISFTFESDGMITAFPGRANRETFRLKPSDPTGLVLEDGWFDFEANDVRRVEISMLETTGVKIISSDTDSITRERSKLHVRMGDMPIKSSTKEFEPTVSVFVGDDERGVVMTAPGLSGAPKVKYYSTTARAV